MAGGKRVCSHWLLVLGIVLLSLSPTWAQVCRPDGNVDQDAEISFLDVVLTLQHFLGIADPPLDTCAQTRANVVDPTGSAITPADARCILQRVLGQPSCLDNAPPVLDPVGDQRVALGTTLRFQLTATDPDGDPLVFAVQPLPLPDQAMFDSVTGTFTFTPTAVQVGAFALTFSVSDGQATTTETVTVAVVAGSGVTALSGVVLTTDNAPLPGVRLEVAGRETRSGADGAFRLRDLPPGQQRLLIDGSTVDPGRGTFATVPEVVTLIAGTDNVLRAPIFLLPLDVASADPIDPAQDSVITSSPVMINGEQFPAVVLTVPAGTARREDTGEMFAGLVHISQIPAPELGPMPLPEDIDLSVYIAVQPFGVRYDPPVEIAFPNVENFPVGAIVDIFGLNHDTGAFEKVGEGQVRADGMVHSIGGVVRNNSWHGFVPQPPLGGPQPDPGPPCPDDCNDQGVGSSGVNMRTGDLRVEHDVVPYTSLGRRRTLRLEYHSSTARPQPLVSTLVTTGNLTPPPSFMATDVVVAGIAYGRVVTQGPPFCPFNCPFIRQPRVVDATAFPTGIYPAAITVDCQFPVSRRSRTFTQDLVVINARQSPFGAGWGLQELQRLHRTATGALLLTQGDDTALVFTPAQQAAAVIQRSGEQDTYQFAANRGDVVTIRLERRTNQADGSGTLDPVLELRTSRGDLLVRDDDSGDSVPAGPGRNALIRSLVLPATDTYTIVAAGQGGSRGPYALALSTSAESTLVASGENAGTPIEAVVLAPRGDFSTLRLRPDGTATRRLKDGTVLRFDAQGLLTATADRNGNTTRYAYDAAGRLRTITDPVGGVTTLRYTAGLLSEIEDPARRVTRFTHDADGNLTVITDPDGSTRQFTYDDQHLMQTQTNQRDLVTRYEYDFAGRFVRTILPDTSERRLLARQSQGLVDPASGTGTETNPAPFVLEDEVQSQFTDGNGTVTTVARTDALGNPIVVSDALRQQTVFDRDAHSLIVRIQRPNNTVLRLTYDDQGNRTSLFQEAINATDVFTYEPVFNRIQTYTTPEGQTTTFAYDANGNLTEIVDANGTRLGLGYDDPACPGQLTSVTSAVGQPEEQTTTLAYDPTTCNVLQTTDALGRSARRLYDAAGNITQTCTALGQITRFRYDARNRLLKVLDATTTPLDPTCAPVTEPEAPCPTVGTRVNGVTCFTYDARGNLTSAIDARGNRTQFEYDALDRRIAAIDPLGNRATFTYDGNGNLLTQSDRRGQVIERRYDALNRLAIEILLPGTAAEEVTTFRYDTVGNLTAVVDPDSRLTMSYDGGDRLTSMSTAGAPVQPEVVITYTYDGNNNLLTMTDPTGESRFTYDALDRMTTLTSAFGQPLRLAYNALSRRTRLTFPNGVTTDYTYDAASQLVDLVHHLADAPTPLSSFAYTYDGVGNRLTLTQQRAVSAVTGTLTYVYDALNRLLRATHPLTSQARQAFTYDAVGNRQEGQRPAARFDSANRLRENGQFCYDYDANGNLTQRTVKVDGACTGAVTTYTYDARNRLVRIDQPDGSVTTYRYDGLGERIEKNVDGTITRYVYKDNRDLLLEFNGANRVVARYTHGPGLDGPLVMERDLDANGTFDPTERFFYHADALGSITELTDTTGAVRQAYVYDAFGHIVGARCGAQTFTSAAEAQTALGDPAVCLANPYTYTGREYDPETRLYYYRARHYDAPQGRFVQEDPRRQSAANLYSYVNNNPVNLFDPLGLTPVGRLTDGPGGRFFPPGLGDFPENVPAPSPGECQDPLNPTRPLQCGPVPEDQFQEDDEERVPTEVYVIVAVVAAIGICILLFPPAAPVLAAGASDRRKKENFAPVDTQEILERLVQLPITTWNYKRQKASMRHIGPMAQDFAAAFGVGEDDRHIHFLDANGVALAAIQELCRQLQAKETAIAALQQHNSALEARLAALETQLCSLAATTGHPEVLPEESYERNVETKR